MGIGDVEVATFMTFPVHCLSYDMTVRAAIEMLINKQISGAPLTDINGHLMGIFSEFDLMQLAAMKQLNTTLANIEHRWYTPAPQVHKILPNTKFIDAFKLLLSSKNRRIIVTDPFDVVQGIIARREIIREFVVKDQENFQLMLAKYRIKAK